MARAIWTGSVTFGLVSIPVALYSATEDRSFHFNQFQRGTSDRIRYRRVNERTGEEVEYSDIVKGAEVGDGQYVIIEPEELEAIAPGRSRSLEILAFVDLKEIDPIYFQKTYWLGPAGEQYAKPYALLVEAMERTNRVGIARFVMRNKEYLAAIRADNGTLALETLFYADEIRNPTETVEHIPSRDGISERELQMATGLIEAMSGPWKPEEYHDTYRERVAQLIEDKRQGREIVTETAAPEPTGMGDLIAALERSIAAARGKASAQQTAEAQETAEPAEKPKRRDDAPNDLANASKAELIAMARELDIAGRSKMSRDELAEAVAKAAGERRRKVS